MFGTSILLIITDGNATPPAPAPPLPPPPPPPPPWANAGGLSNNVVTNTIEKVLRSNIVISLCFTPQRQSHSKLFRCPPQAAIGEIKSLGAKDKVPRARQYGSSR
jgi:hypothetical protein